MIRIIVTFLILLVSVLVGVQLIEDPGYALFAFRGWTIELPLWLLVLMALVSFLVLHWLTNFISFIGSSVGRVKKWSMQRRLQQAQSLTSQALLELTEGQWAKAEQHLIKSLPHADSKVVNYIAAARAAQQQGAYKRRDRYLKKAQAEDNQHSLAAEITEAECLMASNQLEQALSILQQLQLRSPRQPQVLMMLEQIYLRQGQWDHLLALLPDLAKVKLVDKHQRQRLEIKSYAGKLTELARGNDAEALVALWHSLPYSAQKTAELNYLLAQGLIRFEQYDLAESALQRQLKRQFDDGLIQLYSQLKTKKPEQTLAFAEKLLKSHPENTELLFTLAVLSERQKLWGKARSYYEACLQFKNEPRTLLALAKLLEYLGESQRAQALYKRSLQLQAQHGLKVLE